MITSAFSHFSLRIKVLIVTIAVFVPAMLGGTAYFFYESYWLTVTTSLNSLMNFVDGKQQGVIRFIGQNEKLAKQLAHLVDDAGPATAHNHFATIVATYVFKLEDHPFKDEIKSGKRSIATMQVYHAIDFIKDGTIQVSSNKEREGKPWSEKLNLAPGYSNVWKDGSTPVLSFAAKTKDGEIGNLEGDTGAFYLAGVGKTTHESAQKGTDLMARVQTSFTEITASTREMAGQVVTPFQVRQVSNERP